MHEMNPRNDIMSAIREGRVRMKPRWRFVLASTLAALGVLIILLTLLYITSFGMFMMRHSGALFMPVFGMRGVMIFLRSLPLILIGLLLVFVLLLQVIVRRYSVGYRTPLLVSVGAICVIIFCGGIALDRTPIHGQLYEQARNHGLPPPINDMYRSGGAPVPEVERGTIIGIIPGGLLLREEDGDGTTTVLIDPHTRLPFGADFAVGQEIAVLGDEASGTIHAFGIRRVGD